MIPFWVSPLGQVCDYLALMVNLVSEDAFPALADFTNRC